MQASKKNRRGNVFSLRLTDEQRAELEQLRASTAGPRGLGPWLVWAAREASRGAVLPNRVGNTGADDRGGNTRALSPRTRTPVGSRLILDLCGGSGSWSHPYAMAGYRVETVDLLNGRDVHTLAARSDVWGILAAPPCTEFSLAKNGQERDFRAGLETVSACIRIAFACQPQWWALENPTGLLSIYLGTARDVWEPYEFGDPWTKRTAIWGDFAIPERGPFVKPLGSAMDRGNAAARAITPPGFARAFFEANP
jgi:hypothetical protein